MLGWILVERLTFILIPGRDQINLLCKPSKNGRIDENKEAIVYIELETVKTDRL